MDNITSLKLFQVQNVGNLGEINLFNILGSIVGQNFFGDENRRKSSKILLMTLFYLLVTCIYTLLSLLSPLFVP
jgi:hypothetical protein